MAKIKPTKTAGEHVTRQITDARKFFTIQRTKRRGIIIMELRREVLNSHQCRNTIPAGGQLSQHRLLRRRTRRMSAQRDFFMVGYPASSGN